MKADDIAIEIDGLREELTEVNNKWLRALADLDNYKKRVDRERCRSDDYQDQSEVNFACIHSRYSPLSCASKCRSGWPRQQ